MKLVANVIATFKSIKLSQQLSHIDESKSN